MALDLLLVEDNERELFLLELYLKKHRHNTNSTRRADSAFDTIRDKNYDAVICDHGLGSKTGEKLFYETVELYKRMKRDRPFFIMFSGYAESLGHMYHHEGVEVVLKKGFDEVGELLQKITHTLTDINTKTYLKCCKDHTLNPEVENELRKYREFLEEGDPKDTIGRWQALRGLARYYRQRHQLPKRGSINSACRVYEHMVQHEGTVSLE